MSEPAAPHPDPSPADYVVPPMPYPGATTPPSQDGAVPPMPSAATSDHRLGGATARRWHTAMTPLRKMMHRSPPDAA
jgi:hypothetical protein